MGAPFLRRFYTTTRDYCRSLRNSYQDLWIPCAVAIVLMAVGDRVVLWAVGLVAHSLAGQIEETPRWVRVLVCGWFPAAVFLCSVVASEWLRLWRINRLRP